VSPPPSAAPPRLAEWLARAASPGAEWRDVSAGDLHEEFVAISARQGSRAARRWYWRQASSLLVEAAGRLTRGLLAGAAAFVRPRGDRPMTVFVQEARLAWRALVHQPLTSGIVIVTLALGLGANIATFGMIDALVLRPFTLPDVDRLVLISENSVDDPFPRETIAPAHALAYAEPARTFDGAATFGWWDVNLAGPTEAERVLGFRVSADFFRLLGASPVRGRLLDAEDMVWGRHRQVVVSEGLWIRRFAADPAIIGTTIRIDGEPFTVVGILPKAFTFPDGSEIWTPLAFDAKAAANHTSHYLTTFARLAPGASREAAAAELEARFNAISAPQPEANRGRRLVVRPFTEGMIDIGMPQILGLWQAAALLVLLIGCTNVANLLLARGAARQRELAVRLAIGANRWRLVRQLLTEGVLLALVATPAALGVAALVFRLLKAAMPAMLVRFVPGWDRMAVNAGLAGWAVLAAIVTAVVFSLLPALQASRPNVTGTLRDGGRSMSGLAARSRLRRGLVVAEIALALPLLIASGLSAVGAQRFASGPQGYDPDGVLRARTILPEATYATSQSRLQFAEQLVEAARQIPGVELAGTSSVLPSGTSNQSRRLTIDGRPPDPDSPININYRAISPDYLAALRVPILQGRALTSADREISEPVVVISESAARRLWLDGTAVGGRIRLGDADQPWRTVVGVAGDTIDDWFMYRKEITAYVPVAQAPTASVNLVVRTSGDPASLADAVRSAVASLDRTQPLFEVMTMREALKVRTTGLRFVSGLMAGFGVLALVLATVGIYSVMAFYVAQRRHEMGIRLALGATSGDIVRLTVGQGARLAALGIVVGLGFGVALARLMESVLFGIVALEPWLFAAIAALLAVSALAASLLPARHAAQADPALALRQ
jgi:putative ABC transport system permease protein